MYTNRPALHINTERYVSITLFKNLSAFCAEIYFLLS